MEDLVKKITGKSPVFRKVGDQDWIYLEDNFAWTNIVEVEGLTIFVGGAIEESEDDRFDTIVLTNYFVNGEKRGLKTCVSKETMPYDEAERFLIEQALIDRDVAESNISVEDAVAKYFDVELDIKRTLILNKR